jgi:hypothetical protein
MHASRFLPALLVAVLALGLASCDAAGPGDTFELEARRVTFQFTFDGGQLTTANLRDFTSSNQVDLRDYVRQRGFAPEDIVGARVQSGSARLRVGRPLQATVGSFSRAEIRTFQGTMAGATLATGTTFPTTGDTAQLIVQTSNFGNTVASGPFSAILALQGTSAALSGEYFVEVTLDIVISVEG